MKFVAIFLLTACIVSASEPNPPRWDTKWVKFIDPKDSYHGQRTIDDVWHENGGSNPGNHGQWSSSRYALMMKPGYHAVDLNLGFYTQVVGLGRYPTDTRIRNFWSPNGSKDKGHGALCNFWRGIENVQLNNQHGAVVYAVSQAAPMRRVHIDGDLNLSENGGYSSGGYLSDAKVTGNIYSGSQQQWFSRNVEMGSWHNGVWNMVFLGCRGAPRSHCSNHGGSPYTTVDSTPKIAEKPYIIMDGSQFKLMIPNYESNKVGHTSNWQNAKEVDFS